MALPWAWHQAGTLPSPWAGEVTEIQESTRSKCRAGGIGEGLAALDVAQLETEEAEGGPCPLARSWPQGETAWPLQGLRFCNVS